MAQVVNISRGLEIDEAGILLVLGMSTESVQRLMRGDFVWRSEPVTVRGDRRRIPNLPRTVAIHLIGIQGPCMARTTKNLLRLSRFS